MKIFVISVSRLMLHCKIEDGWIWQLSCSCYINWNKATIYWGLLIIMVKFEKQNIYMIIERSVRNKHKNHFKEWNFPSLLSLPSSVWSLWKYGCHRHLLHSRSSQVFFQGIYQIWNWLIFFIKRQKELWLSVISTIHMHELSTLCFPFLWDDFFSTM